MPPAALPLAPALAALFCLLAFIAIAGIDGLYFHLYRYRLHARPASRYEHWLHTLNAVLFVPQIALLFLLAPSGALLWVTLLLFLTSLSIEVLDVLCEEASRKDLGGLLRSEYLMHFLMSGAHVGWVLPLLCAPPLSAWRLSQTALQPRPLWMLLCGAWIGGPAVLVAVLHLVLAGRGGTRPHP